MSTLSITEIRNWLVSNNQWSPAKGFYGSPTFVYNAAQQYQVTADELDAAMSMPPGTIAKYLSDHGLPPLTGGRAPIGPHVDSSAPLPTRRAPSPSPSPAPAPSPSSAGHHPGDVVTNASGTFLVLADGTLQPMDNARQQPVSTRPTTYTEYGPHRARTPSPAPKPTGYAKAPPIAVHEVAPATGSGTPKTAAQNVRSNSFVPPPGATFTPASTPLSTGGPTTGGAGTPYAPSASDYASAPSGPVVQVAEAPGVSALGLSSTTLAIGLAGAAALVLLTRGSRS